VEDAPPVEEELDRAISFAANADGRRECDGCIDERGEASIEELLLCV